MVTHIQRGTERAVLHVACRPNIQTTELFNVVSNNDD